MILKKQENAGSLTRLWRELPLGGSLKIAVLANHRPPPGGGWHAKRDWGRGRIVKFLISTYSIRGYRTRLMKDSYEANDGCECPSTVIPAMAQLL